MSDTLTMFFDSDFNLSLYVDKLLQNIVQSSGPSAYSQESLSKLNNDISSLSTHLDYYTNELSSNLSAKLDDLEQNNKQINVLESSESSLRLQYQGDMLNNAILSLQQDLQQINEEVNEEDSPVILTLIQLKGAKSNMYKVIEVFDLINELIGKRTPNFDGTVSQSDFQKALDGLLESAKRGEITTSIDKLVEVAPVFEGLGRFGLAYGDFARKLADQARRT